MILLAILIVVIPFLVFYINKARKEHPKGLIAAALSNMGERFGYYIMNAVLLLFICSKFGISDDAAGWIYAVFYFLIYVLSLPGGIIADRTQNYKGTIITGLCVMALGYGMLSIPVFAEASGFSWVLVFTCVALFIIAMGNGLFKGNLQAVVGQMYDNFEAEAAKKGPEALAEAKSKRDTGFQIFYVFINIGGVIAPFVAPLLRSLWLNLHNLSYNADLPRLCHKFLEGAETMNPVDQANLASLAAEVGHTGEVTAEFCGQYLNVFNTGVHYSFIASVVAMLISLVIFFFVKNRLPNPAKKEKKAVTEYSAEEKAANAKEIKQRLYALFAVLGVAVFFWFSFHQNGQSLSVFARDFVATAAIPPEIWQCINPLFVILLTPVIMWVFAALSKKGREVSTPRKIVIGMFLAACAYIFLAAIAIVNNYPSGEEFKGLADAIKVSMKCNPMVLILTYFFLTVAELFISPLGLSFVSKIAPRHLQGICQALWLTATAIGNLFIAIGVTMLNTFPEQWMCWAVFAVFCLISMGVMLGMVKWLERVTNA
ncbi:MAG: peptide MFS transporter [Bacteroidales bacterium]|nr:peptide MFS transporter [Bacteroidales bacterium]